MSGKRNTISPYKKVVLLSYLIHKIRNTFFSSPADAFIQANLQVEENPEILDQIEEEMIDCIATGYAESRRQELYEYDISATFKEDYSVMFNALMGDEVVKQGSAEYEPDPELDPDYQPDPELSSEHGSDPDSDISYTALDDLEEDESDFMSPENIKRE